MWNNIHIRAEIQSESNWSYKPQTGGNRPVFVIINWLKKTRDTKICLRNEISNGD